MSDDWPHAVGYLKMLEIPKGARHLVIQEFKGSPHTLGRWTKDAFGCPMTQEQS